MTDQINSGFYKFKIGQFNCISVSDGTFDYNPMQFFPGMDETDIRKSLTDLQVNPDKLVSPYTFLFVDTGKHKILCDMGAGKLGPNTGKLTDNLRLAGIQPEAVDIVIITHAHPDHVGGTLDDSGKPRYPNARYYMWKAEWDFWFSDEAIEEAVKHYSTLTQPQIFIKVARGQLGPIKERITFLQEESEILPGVCVHATPGHTPGHIVISFSSEGEELFFAGDAITFSFLLERPDLKPVFDLLPDLAQRTRREFCNRLADKKAWIVVQHAHPFPSLGHIKRKGEGWKWESLLIQPDIL